MKRRNFIQSVIAAALFPAKLLRGKQLNRKLGRTYSEGYKDNAKEFGTVLIDTMAEEKPEKKHPTCTYAKGSGYDSKILPEPWTEYQWAIDMLSDKFGAKNVNYESYDWNTALVVSISIQQSILIPQKLDCCHRIAIVLKTERVEWGPFDINKIPHKQLYLLCRIQSQQLNALNSLML